MQQGSKKCSTLVVHGIVIDTRHDAAAHWPKLSIGLIYRVLRTCTWNTEQALFKTKVTGFVDEVLQAQEAEGEPAADALREAIWNSHKICVCTGPPGSGKSTVATL